MVQLLGGNKQIIEGERIKMNYTNKEQYIQALINAMTRCGVTDQREILTDFEQHFADGAAAGESEAQVCEKLGDPEEIAKQYASEDFFEEQPAAQNAADASGFGAEPGTAPAQNTSYAPPPVQQNGFRIQTGAVIGVVCVDIFVFSWAIPALASVIIGLYSTVVGLVGAGLGLFIGGVAAGAFGVPDWLYTCFSPVSTALLGVVLASGSLLLVGPCVAAGRGFINICINIINWHSRTLVGRNVLGYIGKKAKA